MTKNSTQQQEINRRRQIVSKLRHEGVRSQDAITARLRDDYGIDVTRQTISNDLKALDKLWRNSALVDTDKWKKEILKQYRYLYQQSLSAWELSLEDAEEVNTDTIKDGDSDKTIPIEKTKIKGQSGNPAHIRNAQEALKAIREMFGVDVKSDPGSSEDKPLFISVKEWQSKQEKTNQDVNSTLGDFDEPIEAS